MKKTNKNMKKRLKIARILFIVFITIILLSNFAFAQQKIKIRVNEWDDVIRDTIFKWYETTETTETVDGKDQLKFIPNDAYKTQRMIVDMVLFFALFAGLIYYSLNRFMGESNKGALAVLTIALSFGLSLALVTQTKYGSLSVFFPFARNIIFLTFFILVFYLLKKLFNSTFWAFVLAIVLAILAFGGIPILFCDPGEDCLGGFFKEGIKDTGKTFKTPEAMTTDIEKDIIEAERLLKEGTTLVNSEDYLSNPRNQDKLRTILQSAINIATKAKKDIEIALKKPGADKDKLTDLNKRADEVIAGARRILKDQNLIRDNRWASLLDIPLENSARCKEYASQAGLSGNYACVNSARSCSSIASLTQYNVPLCGSGLKCASGCGTAKSGVAPSGPQLWTVRRGTSVVQ